LSPTIILPISAFFFYWAFAAWEAEIGRIMVGDKPGQKISETLYQQTSCVW
jgi:hypothetical protein